MPLEEKLKYHNLEDLHNGEYNGYRPAGLRQYVLFIPEYLMGILLTLQID